MKKSTNTKQSTKKKSKRPSSFYMCIFILIIMILSIAGFALMSGGGISSNKSEYLNQDIPLHQFEYQGQTYWGAVKNGQQFIFVSIDGYEENLVMAELANQIRTKEMINIYVDEGFENSDAKYSIEKILSILNIPMQYISELNCTSDTLVLTNNETFEGDCMKFISTNEEATRNSEILTYHIIK